MFKFQFKHKYILPHTFESASPLYRILHDSCALQSETNQNRKEIKDSIKKHKTSVRVKGMYETNILISHYSFESECGNSEGELKRGRCNVPTTQKSTTLLLLYYIYFLSLNDASFHFFVNFHLCFVIISSFNNGMTSNWCGSSNYYYQALTDKRGEMST